MSQKELYEQKIQAQVNLWKAELDKLSAKALDADADAKLKLDKQRASLQEKIDQGQEEMKKIRETSADAFDEMKIGMGNAWSSLTDAASKAADKFK